jgi:hypothetical protein
MERDGEKVGNVSNDNTTKGTLCMTSILTRHRSVASPFADWGNKAD